MADQSRSWECVSLLTHFIGYPSTNYCQPSNITIRLLIPACITLWVLGLFALIGLHKNFNWTTITVCLEENPDVHFSIGIVTLVWKALASNIWTNPPEWNIYSKFRWAQICRRTVFKVQPSGFPIRLAFWVVCQPHPVFVLMSGHQSGR